MEIKQRKTDREVQQGDFPYTVFLCFINIYMFIYIYIYMYLYIYVYVYIYIKVVIRDPRYTECSNLTEAR